MDMIKILGKQKSILPDGETQETSLMFDEIIKNYGGETPRMNMYFLLGIAFNYGVIMGKRQDRAKRRNKQK